MTTATPTTKKSSAPVAVTAPAPAPAPAPVQSTVASNGFSVAALVLAITGIVLGQAWLSIASIVFGFVARSKEPAGRLTANWGIALGFAGVLGGFLLGVIGFAAFLPLWIAGAAWGF
ncbi:MAG: hypothetical protein ABI632_12195 [Pseudolysinimonas sp.]